jgi:hypothetical protein
MRRTRSPLLVAALVLFFSLGSTGCAGLAAAAYSGESLTSPTALDHELMKADGVLAVFPAAYLPFPFCLVALATTPLALADLPFAFVGDLFLDAAKKH